MTDRDHSDIEVVWSYGDWSLALIQRLELTTPTGAVIALTREQVGELATEIAAAKDSGAHVNLDRYAR